MGCLTSFAKYILFIFNFLILVAAIILIAFGAIMLKDEGKLNGKAITDFSVGGFGVAVGVIILAISFFGCCGAIKQNKCLLNTYAVILILLLILQIVLAALAFTVVNDENKLFKKITEVLGDIYKDGNADDIKNIEDNFDCCGTKGYEASLQNCNINIKDVCDDAVLNTVKGSLKIVGGVAIAFAIVELVGAVFACMVKPN